MLRLLHSGGEVVETGNASDSKAEFHSDEEIARVVFFTGAKAAEKVAGAVDLEKPKKRKVSVKLES